MTDNKNTGFDRDAFSRILTRRKITLEKRETEGIIYVIGVLRGLFPDKNDCLGAAQLIADCIFDTK